MEGLEKYELYPVFKERVALPATPVRCTEEDRAQWRGRLDQLVGTTRYAEFDAVFEFAIAWARVREVFRCGDGGWLVRYEIRNRQEKSAKLPLYQLLARFSLHQTLDGYTVVHEKGGAEPINARLVIQSGDRYGDITCNPAEVLDFIGNMQKNDFAIVCMGDCDCNYAQVYCDRSDPEPLFTIEWQCGCFIWQFETRSLSREETAGFFKIYMEKGLGAAQAFFADWRPVDWEGVWDYNGKGFAIGRYLSAMLLKAVRTGDRALEARLTALGFRADIESVDSQNLCVDTDEKSGADRWKILRIRAGMLQRRKGEMVRLFMELMDRIPGRIV